MDLKNKILNNKKIFIGTLASLVIGLSIGFGGNVPQSEFDSVSHKKVELSSQIDIVENEISSESEKLKELEAEKSTVSNELTQVLEEKRIAKEAEEARLAKEAKDARLAQIEADKIAKAEADRIASNAQNNNNNNNNNNTSNNSSSSAQSEPVGQMVWKTSTGSRYHNKSNCGNSQTSVQVTLDSAKSSGLTACKNCYR